VRRIVSLVPSLTEAVASSDIGALVGATQWCTHPAELDIVRVRGTKNPDVRAIAALRPDLVLANKEENRRLDVERLRARGISVWVTDIETVAQALASLDRLFVQALGWDRPEWLTKAANHWRAPDPEPACRVIIPIWRDPWMLVGSRTFTGDLARRSGLVNLYGSHSERYPTVPLAELNESWPDLVLLPDEPYPFGPDDGPESFPEHRSVCVEGRMLTWYGPSLATARDQLRLAVGLTDG
jgi:ABC-type Fe3+-hydroxamate transport system substrate-binding protein